MARHDDETNAPRGRPSPRRVSLPLLAALVAACSRDAEEAPPPTLLLTAVENVSGVLRHRELPAGVRIEWIADGLAGVHVTLDSAAGESRVVGERRFVRWTLPLPSAAEASPPVEDDVLRLPPPRVEGSDVAIEYRIDTYELNASMSVDAELPESLELVYPTYSSPLELEVTPALVEEQRFHAPRWHGRLVNDSLCVPAGGYVTLSLPASSGRLFGWLSALQPRPSVDTPTRVRLELDGRVLVTVRVPEDGTAVELAADGLPLTVERPGQLFEVHVEGEPGAVAFFEAPEWRRAPLPEDGPNLLLVVVDTLRADRLTAWGGADGLTPRLDALCAESLRFAACWSASSWTLPSVATMLTSNHPGQHRAWQDLSRLGTGLDTLAEVLRRKGYRTAAFTDGAYLGHEFGMQRGFTTFDSRGGGVEAVVERTRRFLESDDGTPWFVLLHTYEVHSPYDPPAELQPDVDLEALLGRIHGPKPFVDQIGEGRPIAAEIAGTLEALYDAEVRHTDEVLGGFLLELGESGVLDASLLCVTSDHGEEFGDHGFLGHGDTLYVEQLHVPLFLRFPDGAHPGETDGRPVSLVDLAPTLLDGLGLRDEIARTTFVGRSLLGGGTPSPVFASRNKLGVGEIEALREGPMVLIDGVYQFPGPRPEGPELYRIDSDPRQARPLEGGEVGRELGALEARLRELSELYGEARARETEVDLQQETRLELQKLGYVDD